MAGNLTIDSINGKVISSSPVATESQVIGVGQTWQDVTASRSAGVTYTNSTGKPIEVSVSATAGGGAFYISGIVVGIQNGTQICTSSFVIPNGATYSTTYAINKWSELR